MSVRIAGERLTAGAARVRVSLEAALAQCRRAHGPRGGGGGDRGPSIPRRRRRVPTGEAGAALLGQILRGPFVEGGPGTALPGTQAGGKK